ncbi:MAG TPA: hypothetical protein VEJ18_16160, partial [Planctomycetota bacterium]|nr:hypothetical protein [Planctomycetota bacterium]
MHRRGAALIGVLGALTVLAALAAAFASGTLLDRRTSRNFLDATRARMLARSGIDTAVARLQGLVDSGAMFDGRTWAPCGHAVDGRCAGPTAVVEGRIVGCSEPLGGTYARNGDLATFRAVDAQAR